MEPLDPSHPKFSEVSRDFINLHMIELNFRSGKYQSTFHLGLDVRKMWSLAYKLYSDDPEKYQKTQEIQQYFETVFADLDNKPLQGNGPLPIGAAPESAQQPQPPKVNA